MELKAWPYHEARQIIEKLDRERTMGKARKHDHVLLQTGFGPSGLPHMGTFGEVARTNWVRQALERIDPALETKLYAFSDDMDGMRGVPLDADVALLREHLGKPLSQVPDPFGDHESFAAHMNAKLCEFLDSFGFEYEFKSSAEQYASGVFNEGLRRIVDRYDEVRELVTATLRGDNRETWSPFLPVCEHCGRVNTTRVTGLDRDNYTVSYACDRPFNAKILSWEPHEGAKAKTEGEGAPTYYVSQQRVHGCGGEGTVPVTDGHVKVGWKVDWAMRWYVFGVDYEMYGKDLIDSAEVSAKIVSALGGEPPVGMVYEWFNDEHNRSISKTKGNGLTIDQWLEHGPIESLSWFVYQTPSKAKRLYAGIIPQTVDKFLEDRGRFGREEEAEQVNNPIQFVEADKLKAGKQVGYESDLTFGVIVNLVSVLGTDDRDLVWDYLLRYDPKAREHNAEILDRMISCAINVYRDVVAPTLTFEAPPEEFAPALAQLREFLASYEGDDPEELQAACYSAGKDHDLKLGQWFRAMYRLLIGQDRGPRLGTFIHLYGVSETLALIDSRLAELSA